jgi:hypothetical protein
MNKLTSKELLAKEFKHIASGVISIKGDRYDGFCIFNAAGDIKLNIMWTFERHSWKEMPPTCVDSHLHNVELCDQSGSFPLSKEQGKNVIDGLLTRLKWEKFAREELEKRFEFRDFSFEPFYIERDNNLPLKFIGAILGSVYETPLNFLKVTLYRTEEGQFVCEKNSDNPDSKKSDNTAEICSTVSEIYNFIDNHALAKQLIQESNVDFSIVVK